MKFNILPNLEQKANNWLTIFVHGLHWENGHYFYINLNQILQSFVLRNPSAVFYVEGKEKTEILAKYLDQKIEKLDDLGCPRIEKSYCKNYPSCNIYIPQYNSRNHCTLKQSKVPYDWLKMNNSEISAKVETYLS